MSTRGYAAIGLHDPKTSANVGAIMRAAGCYSVAMVAMSGHRFKKWSTDTRNKWKHMPLLECENLHDVIPYDCVPIAVDLLDGAKSLVEFVHPERAFYIFGAEDQTLGKSITSWCKHKIYVPTNGCMNLAAAVNVILYDRLAKQLHR